MFHLGFIALLTTSLASASLIGDVSGVHNTPGYIDPRPGSTFYDGIVFKRERNDPIERRTPSEIITSLYDGQTLSPSKVQTYLDSFKGYLATVHALECQSEIGEIEAAACDANPEFQEKWKRNSFRTALEFAQKNLEWAVAHRAEAPLAEINSVRNIEFLDKIYSALEIWEGVQAEDEQRGFASRIKRAISNNLAILEKVDIVADGPDASNLLVPSDHPLFGKQTFLSEEDLKTLKAKGSDLSRLNPPSSALWRAPKKSIARFDTSIYDNEGNERIRRNYSEQEVSDIINPEKEISVVYKPHEITGGATPKFDVMIGKYKWKLKFITNRHAYRGYKDALSEIIKTVTGSEVNVEPAANNLAAALGFTVDPTYFKKKIRVYFSDKVYEEGKFDQALSNMHKALNARFLPTTNISSGVQNVKVDENGRKYIEIKSVTLEQKSNEKTDMNIGFFNRTGLGRDLLREHRAFFLFLAWCADPDLKNDNDKIKIVPNGESHKVMLSNSDMGGAFGIGYPNSYNFPLIKQVFTESDGSVSGLRLNHIRIFKSDIKDAVNFNDAKWFARLLGQLTFDQLEKAFLYSGYPKLIAHYYALLAAGKRNELIRSLGLLNTEFVNDQGEVVKLTALPEFTGTIPGYEEFFKDGLLTDPDNKLRNSELENWNRNWGVGRRIFSQDKNVNKEFRMAIKGTVVSGTLKIAHTLLFDRTIYGRQGIQRARIIDQKLGADCGDDCFMQGLDYGLRNFTPMRFLIDNPNAEADRAHPLWIVDMMRIGFFIGDKGQILQKLIGLDAPSSTTLAVGSRVFKIFEIMKITPVSGMDEYFSETKNFYKLPRYALPGLRDQLVNDLDENGTLIVTSYLGLEAKARMRLVGFPLNLAGARVGMNLVKASRVYIHRKNKEFLVNWDKEAGSSAQVGLNLIDLLVRIPLVNHKWANLSSKERTYIFKDEPEEKAVLFHHLSHSTDEEMLEPYRWEVRKSKARERTFMASLFTGRSYKRTLRKSTVEYENFKKNTEQHIKRVQIEVEKTRKVDIQKAIWTKSGEMLVNDAGEIGASIRLHLNFPAATQEGFVQIMDRNRAYYPKNILFFDTTYIKHYMGEVTSDSELIFTQKMLEKVFDDQWDSESICKVYPSTGCGSRFFKLYATARSHFQKVKSKAYDVKYRSMKKVVQFLLVYESLDVLEFVKSVIGEDKLIENAEIVSSLSAFPGDQSTVRYQSDTKGEEKDFEGFSFNPSLFSDKIRQVLANLFFAPEL